MLVLVSVMMTARADMTAWTSVSGAQLEARLVRVEGDLVILQPVEGPEMDIRLDFLIESDQARVRLVAPPADPEADNDEDSKNWLPVWGVDPYPDAFAVYQDPLFDFVILGNGAGRLFIKDDAGNIIRPAIWVGGFGLDHGKPGANRRFGRPVVGVDTPNLRPVRNPQKLILAGTAQDEVTFERTYTYERGSIKAEFRFDDPRNIEFRSSAIAGVRFHRAVPQEMKPDSEEAEALFSQWTTTVHHAAGRTAFNYWQSMQRFPPKITRIVATGPWGSREVTVTYLGVEAAGRVYAGMPLWNGYGFIARTGGPRPSDRRIGLQISVK